ncbi:MAG TPA: NADH-ubiquinone oxidoreductase-F iron-sulfur binding region domain-containing protein [Acidimicrobiia bacterium]|nr:NADH-ubiquinone oxidoreductase-F iron-sulfur binding region domain-containing protein [Acidimicrobiia bacterium]
MTAVQDERIAPRAPVGVPRLLVGDPDGRGSLDEHERAHGALPFADPAAMLDELEHSGLAGRGGASFPAATKWRAVGSRRGSAVVVANGCEGEPASHKDKLLLTRFPHLVLDGLEIAAMTLRARGVVLAVERTRPDVADSVARAISERVSRRRDAIVPRVAGVPARYVAGEESALVHWLNGGDAKPTNTPPRPFERGVSGRPTLVQNVETLAHVALVARHGAPWFRSVGTVDEPGSMLVTISGAVRSPGVCEVAFGTSITDLVARSGGARGALSAVLVGGYFGTWLPAAVLDDVNLSRADLRPRGAAPGCGVVVAFPAGACGLLETARVTHYLARETAGQCGPCVNGLGAIAGAMDELATTSASAARVREIERWTAMIANRGACHHPDGAIRFVRSALDTFRDEIDRHVHRTCSARTGSPVLPVPSPRASNSGWR